MKKKEENLAFSSEEFLSRLRQRDEAAITQLVQTYTRQLVRAGLGLGFDENRAHELTQSVWVTFFDVVQGFQGRSHIRTFLFGILYNKASELRREQSKVELTDPVENVLDQRFDSDGRWLTPPVDPERFLQNAQNGVLIRQCLEVLPLTQKMAFSLKEIEGNETEEICQVMNISVSNLGVLLFRARNRLRECIERKSR